MLKMTKHDVCVKVWGVDSWKYLKGTRFHEFFLVLASLALTVVCMRHLIWGDLWYKTGFIWFLRLVKETYPAICQWLKLTGHGFSGTEIVYHAYVLTEGFLK